MIQTNETKYTAQMYNDLLRRKDALEAENKRLREALRPFARASDALGYARDNQRDWAIWARHSTNPDDCMQVTVGDLTSAAEAMNGCAE